MAWMGMEPLTDRSCNKTLMLYALHKEKVGKKIKTKCSTRAKDRLPCAFCFCWFLTLIWNEPTWSCMVGAYCVNNELQFWWCKQRIEKNNNNKSIKLKHICHSSQNINLLNKTVGKIIAETTSAKMHECTISQGNPIDKWLTTFWPSSLVKPEMIRCILEN